MADRDPDKLFRRFVGSRDVRALGELFDLAAPQLARVAWHLVHDANEVEDLVQATFLTALDSARSFDPARPVMPWLLGILTNHAHNARRAAGRRPVELATEPADPRTPESAAEQRELREAVDRALADLPEMYRAVVASWLLDGEQPISIARREGKPASTVRVQLRRGLELLRNTLPAGAAALAASSVLSPRSLARARERVMARAAESAAAPIASSAAVAMGGVVMAKWLLGAAALLALAAGMGWFATRPASPPVERVTVGNASSEPFALDADLPAQPLGEMRSEVALATADADAHAEPAALRPGWWIVGRVAGAVDGEPARVSTRIGEAIGQDFVQLPAGHASGFDVEVSGATFEIEVSDLFRDRETAPRSFVVRYDHPRFLPTHAKVDVAAQIDLDRAFASERVDLHADFAPTPAELVVTGRVVAPEPIEGAEVVVALFRLDAQGEIQRDAMEHTSCRSDGSFRLRSPHVGAHALAAVHPGFRPETRVIAADARGVVDLGELSLARGEHIAGVVRIKPSEHWFVRHVTANLSGGQPVTLIDVPSKDGAWKAAVMLALTWCEQRFDYAWKCVATDERGNFRFDGLAQANYSVSVDAAMEDSDETEAKRLGYCPADESRRVDASQDGVLFDLRREVLRLEVRADGRPVEHASVAMLFPYGRQASTVSAGSRYELSWNGDQPPLVRVEREGYAPAEFRAAAGEEGVHVVELTPAEALVELVLQPVFECRPDARSFAVSLNPLGEDSTRRRGARDAEFRADEPTWRFLNVLPGRYQIFVSANSLDDQKFGECVAPSVTRELAGGTTNVPLVFVAGGHFAFELRGSSDLPESVSVADAAGRDIYAYVAYFDSSRGRESRIASWSFKVPIGVRVATVRPLAPGDYTLTWKPRDERAPIERGLRIVSGETTELVFDLPKPGGN